MERSAIQPDSRVGGSRDASAVNAASYVDDQSHDEPPVTSWVPIIDHILFVIANIALAGMTLLAWHQAWYLLLPPLWIALAWVFHTGLMRLHEAAHGTVSPRRWFNELHGIVMGIGGLTPLSVFRFVHSRHHAHLGHEDDPEFWPYNLPAVPRAVRIFYAWSELLGGWLVTPALYSFRTLAAFGSVPRTQRVRLVLEWLLLLAFWGLLIWLVAVNDWWMPFIVAYVVPAWLAGSLQTFRKFIEHLGMFGENVFSMSRTVVHRSALGKIASRSQLHIDHHGTHHRWARIPYFGLPAATDTVLNAAGQTSGQEADDAHAGRAGDTRSSSRQGLAPTDARFYPNHATAILEMLPSLLDPKVGPQWNGHRH